MFGLKNKKENYPANRGSRDVTFPSSGTGHGINNPNDEPLDIIALIIYG